MDILLLNASEEILDIIDWVRAVKLLFAEKAEKPCNHTDCYKIKTSSGYFDLPSVIILRKYVHVPFVRCKLPSKRNVHRRDGNRCQYCGCHLNSRNSSVDHVMPRSRGGDHSWGNMVSACKPCNRKKANRTPKEAGMCLAKTPTAPAKNAIMLHRMEKRGEWEPWVSILKL
jgi:5-methylcytosine-specific restriction endonuclease McrA